MFKPIFKITLIKSLLIASCGLASAPAFADGEAKNVIFFLGDGMGPTVVTAARIYKYGEDGKLTMETFPRTGRVRTYSNDAQTTDSAPSMAAYMTGVKMNNDVISMSPDTSAYDRSMTPPKAYITGADSTCPASGNGTPVRTILEMAKARGLSTGVVTTTRITHATPAATYSHICHRDGENSIAAQAVPGGAGYNTALGTDGVDVLLGGGSGNWIPNKNADGSANAAGSRTDTRNLTTEMTAKGYTYVTTATALTAVTPAALTSYKLLGLFNKSHMNFEADRAGTTEPSLSDMASKAVDVLAAKSAASGQGYFLMVEGGRIDQALHPTFGRRAMEDTIAFDNAIKTVLGKVDLKNTLIVVTADHDHTLTLNGYQKRTGPTVYDATGTATTPGILGQVKNVVTGVAEKDADGFEYSNMIFGNGENRPDTRASVSEATMAGKEYHQEAGVRMTSGNETHGSGDVMLMATGAGADTVGFKGTMVNTRVFELMRAAYGF